MLQTSPLDSSGDRMMGTLELTEFHEEVETIDLEVLSSITEC